MKTKTDNATEEATCECTTCGQQFTTSAHPNGDIIFDGVREHGKTHHADEQWNYEVINRPSKEDA